MVATFQCTQDTQLDPLGGRHSRTQRKRDLSRFPYHQK